VRDELRWQPRLRGGPLEVLLVTAAHDQLVLAALEQVPVGRGAVPGDVLVDRLADVEVPRGPAARCPAPGRARP
jgi:hypothetical protein